MFKQKKQKNTAAENRLGANQKIGILFCAMVSAVATGYVPNYINLYYTDAVGISMGAVAMILMITKITDGVTDIIMGMIIDRTHTQGLAKQGRGYWQEGSALPFPSCCSLTARETCLIPARLRFAPDAISLQTHSLAPWFRWPVEQ